MIERVEGLESPVEAGESREVAIWATSEQLSVEIICFVDPPGRFRPCPECGTLRVRSGTPFIVEANRRVFALGGELQLVVSEPDGTREVLTLHVNPLDRERGGGRLMTAG
jgi:hypothetical protein